MSIFCRVVTQDNLPLRAGASNETHHRGMTVVAVEPDPRGIVASYHAALDAAAADGPIAVGGISIGAAVALRWARRNPARAAFVLAALPPWTGASNGAPAAHSARYTATSLRA